MNQWPKPCAKSPAKRGKPACDENGPVGLAGKEKVEEEDYGDRWRQNYQTQRRCASCSQRPSPDEIAQAEQRIHETCSTKRGHKCRSLRRRLDRSGEPTGKQMRPKTTAGCEND